MSRSKKKKIKKPEPQKVIYNASDIKDYLSDKFEIECNVFWELFSKLENDNNLILLNFNDFNFNSNFETKDYYNLIFQEFGEKDNDLIIENDL